MLLKIEVSEEQYEAIKKIRRTTLYGEEHTLIDELRTDEVLLQIVDHYDLPWMNED